jgi:hypothetical protein
MALASATQLEIVRIIRELREDAVDEELQAIVQENGEIIDSVLR